MGKRSNFERMERDFYPTPYEAVIPLLPYLSPITMFCEPCAGNGVLIRHLENAGHFCVHARDIEPMASGIDKADALDEYEFFGVCFITNPPWAG